MDIKKEFLKSIPIDKATEEVLIKIMDEKKARDYLIIKEFDSIMKIGDMKITWIYKKLSLKFDVSEDLVRLVISQRQINQI